MAERSSLVRLEKEFDVEVDWRGFELHPETPEGGVSLTRLYPTVRMKDIREYMENFASSFGIYDMQTHERLPNTRRALAMAEFARDKGKLSTFRELAMQAYWKDGKDLENDQDLAELATRAGLDPTAAIEATNSPKYLQRVDALREESYAMGITGIPTIVIGNERVVGCQPYEVLASTARKAGAVSKE
ncbi:MAG: DsbA family protein [Dehalococcoidia bacterium]|nr:MAG: DsbA family protein [Dehalococcoidia bacterium]